MEPGLRVHRPLLRDAVTIDPHTIMQAPDGSVRVRLLTPPHEVNVKKFVTTDTTSSWLVPVLLLMLGGVAIASSVMRFSSITQVLTSGAMPEDPEHITSYVEHPCISALHLLPGIAFMLLGPVQLTPAIRRRWPAVHRVSGRVFVLSGLLTGISAIAMALTFPVLVSHITTAANVISGTAMIVALVIAFRAILHRDIERHRTWMIRAYAIGLVVATLGVFPPTR